MKRMNLILSLLMLLFLFCSQAPARDQGGAEKKDADAAIEEEFKWLRAEAAVFTDIATKTEMDADIAPGIITVLNGSELEERGFHTVWDALSLIPGLDTSMGANGSVQVTVRGVGNVFAPGKIKIMVNNVSVNATFSGEAESVYFIPVEQVERIEVIRGPGSALYGKEAYFGVINVITRHSGNRVFGRYGRFDSYAGGGLISYTLPEQDFKISLNAAGWERGRSGAYADSDYLYNDMDMAGFSQAPGPINDRRKQSDALLNLEYKDFSLLAQWISHERGDYLGEMVILPPENDRYVYKEEIRMAEARWKPGFLTSLEPKFRMGWKQYIWNIDRLYMYPRDLQAYIKTA